MDREGGETMNSRATQAILLAAALLLSTGTAFGFGSKGGGMTDRKDTGMMQKETTREKQDASMKKESTMMDETKAMQDEKPMKKEDADAEKSGMGRKDTDTMGTKDATPMR
jgi:hypothetical protein